MLFGRALTPWKSRCADSFVFALLMVGSLGPTTQESIKGAVWPGKPLSQTEDYASGLKCL